jgi:hypothetical protein
MPSEPLEPLFTTPTVYCPWCGEPVVIGGGQEVYADEPCDFCLKEGPPGADI